MLPTSRGFRVLTPIQRRRVLARLRKRWPPEDRDWWHPYDAVDAETSVLHLQASWLAHNVSIAEFRRRAGIRWSKFWVMGEGTPHWDDSGASFQGEYEVSSAFISPTMSSETICVPTSLEWMVYTDHNEGTYLIGAWLVEAIKDLWPTWERYVWTRLPYEHPPDDGELHAWWEPS
jgi:hypothetical protein